MAFFTPGKANCKVKVDEDDSEAGYLIDKLIAGENINITPITDEDGNKVLVFSSEGGGSGATVATEDISSQFDGSNDTFILPQFYRIKLFVLTGWFPNGALREDVDFEVVNSTTIQLIGDMTPPPNGTRGIVLFDSVESIPTPTNVVDVTDASNIVIYPSMARIFRIEAEGNRTLMPPEGTFVDGQPIIIWHKAVGANRTITLDNGTGGFKFGTSITEITETVEDTIDSIGCFYDATQDKWIVSAFQKGF